MERSRESDVDLHQVRHIVEVKLNAANELLDSGWVLHEIYFGNDDFRPNYVLLSLEDILCPKCGAPGDIEVLDAGERYRYVCSRECTLSPWIANTI